MILGGTIKNTEAQKTKGQNPLGKHKTWVVYGWFQINKYGFILVSSSSG